MNRFIEQFRCLSLILLLASCVRASAETDEQLAFPNSKDQVMRSGHVAEGSHNSYRVTIAAHQKLTIRIQSKNRMAQFFVTAIKEFRGAQPLEFGKFSRHQQSWSARFPDAGDYYVFVKASQDANYSLMFKLQ